MPILKDKRDGINLSAGILISCKSPANPSPWNRPKKKIIPSFDLILPRYLLSLKNTLVIATTAIESAITGSTILELRVKIPEPASIKVMLWAKVKVPVYLRIVLIPENTNNNDRTNKM